MTTSTVTARRKGDLQHYVEGVEMRLAKSKTKFSEHFDPSVIQENQHPVWRISLRVGIILTRNNRDPKAK